ncbi:MarR family winged helix-turn-helix transcriptional regulator [Paenibacillus pasadenensis]|uniref:Transcriptional regulator, MarR family n=1 Tax=Paenibacillus pasadenensis TaxID=217090 RepID=A0A2N5NBQ6_9BACL|nr:MULTISPECIES: MarR family transcriptional regulator [Paenibacillus]PLT47763.1 Transcriptional regulator, MarR family [Paenibacillus pasadenensis]QGG57950.1 MarR family transcriptional regulator [Paenibacillus sp. B01]
MKEEAKRFHAAVQAFIQTMEMSMPELLKECGMTRTQLFALHLVKVKGPCKLALIADKLEVKPSAVTVMMDRLESGGWVRRKPDTVDRRAVFVEITDEGRKALEKFQQLREKLIERRLVKLTVEEQRTLSGLMEKLAEDVPAEGQSAAEA